MMSFLSWQQAHLAGRDRRITYAMGEEGRLRDFIIQTLKKDTLDKVTLWANKNDDEIWAELFTHPLRQSQTKLVTIRDAHKIKNWKPLDTWLREMRTVKTIMEADKPLFSVPMGRTQQYCVRGHQAAINIQTYRSGREKRTCSACDLAESILSKRGRLVLCAPPRTDASRRDAAQMIANLSGASTRQAEYLLEKTNWRVDAAIEVVDKLNLLSAPMTASIIEALGLTVDDTQYEHAMRDGNRKAAVTQASVVNEYEVARVLDRLELWLTQIARVSRLMHTGATTSDISIKLGADWGLTIKLCDWAAKYDTEQVNKATIALANAERDWYSGARTGVLEVLATQW